MALVLVVEDEESFSDALSYMLHKEGFDVAVCPAGPDALAAFDRNGPTWCRSTSCSPDRRAPKYAGAFASVRMCR